MIDTEPDSKTNVEGGATALGLNIDKLRWRFHSSPSLTHQQHTIED